MLILKLKSKTITLAILTSFIGIQFSTIPSIAQNYDIIPPMVDDEELNSSNFDNLPSIDVNKIPANNYLMKDPADNAPLKGSVSTVPTGTAFEVTTNTTVGSSLNEIGDIFVAKLNNPVVVNGSIIIPAGTEAIGQITYIENAGRIGKNGVMDIKFTSIKLPNGPKVPINGKIITVDNSGVLKGGSLKNQIVTSIATGAVTTGGGALAGLTVGGLIGSAGGGAVLGTAAGGFLGLGYLFGRKGKEVVLPTETKLNIILEQPLTVGR